MPKKPSRFSQRLKTIKRLGITKTPAWKGPQEDGVSQSLISWYLGCKERFRVGTIEGLQPKPTLNVPIEFGQMWHLAEEELSKTHKTCFKRVDTYAKLLCLKFPSKRKEIIHWQDVVKTQFLIYVEHWKSDPDTKKRVPILQEEKFKLPYKLPSGRVVWLRGKMDAVDLIKGEGVFLQENKTKTEINEWLLNKQLLFDLQVMFYLTALKIKFPEKDIKGVRYNVIKRATAGGSKGAIKRHMAKGSKPQETKEHFYGRVRDLILEEPTEYFKRWKVRISDEELVRFHIECMIPVLENMCDDYDWWRFCIETKTNRKDVPSWSPFDFQERSTLFPHHQCRHYRQPYGLFSRIDQGGIEDIDNYLMTGSTLGLERTTQMFPELEEENA